jgi:hypothetical protein
MTAEEWRPIPGYAGYFASTEGRIGSDLKGRGSIRVLKGGRRGKYRGLVLCSNGRRESRSFHSLVAETFHGPRPPVLQVRHLDGNSLNNHPSNLRYGTAAENGLDRVEHGADANARKTHCPRGHVYDEANTYFAAGTGHRQCRVCKRIRWAERGGWGGLPAAVRERNGAYKRRARLRATPAA